MILSCHGILRSVRWLGSSMAVALRCTSHRLCSESGCHSSLLGPATRHMSALSGSGGRTASPHLSTINKSFKCRLRSNQHLSIRTPSSIRMIREVQSTFSVQRPRLPTKSESRCPEKIPKCRCALDRGNYVAYVPKQNLS